MLSDQEELQFRETVFAWIRAQQLKTPFFTRDELRRSEYGGQTHRLIGLFTGIWKIATLSDSAIAISTTFVPDRSKRPHEYGEGVDGQRYKWPNTNPNQSANKVLRRAMDRKLPLLWLVGIGYAPLH